MTRALRRRHRLAALGLAICLPPLYVAALAARAPEPVTAGSLAASLGEPSTAAPDGARVAELDTRGLPAQPDALVYWSASAPRGESLPSDVWFLGAAPDDAVRRYRLPAAAGAGGGSLVVFSVALQRVLIVQSLAPEAAP